MGFIKKTMKYDAGNMPIWLSVDRRKTAGGTLKNLPEGPALIPAGTPAYLDEMGGKIEVLETFRVSKAVTSSDTSVEVEATGNLPQITKGQFVMKAPTSYSETGSAITVGAVSEGTTPGTKKFTITAGALGELAIGDVLVVADKTGSDASMAILPNGLIWHDLYVHEGDYAQTAAIVVSGSILESRISPIPGVVKQALPMITFEKEA
ncbi:hypothetical protein DXA95_12360 [Odoribacter sp. OF09-27XD]|jgi:hypothetical protein|nr:hypothetical protein [Odoribacter sp. OF09-27XD]RHV92591.1 hypothetical protein DXA95_12360 [Odoribacter sp. OF09-27XD]DAV89669.1 MAG TPA: Head fiber protein [Bacteriophage sp.]